MVEPGKNQIGGEHALQVLTLNVWGLWLVARDRQLRIRELGKFLASADADLVLLQEVWVQADAQHLIACGRQGGLQHAMHFRSRIFGSGLVTLSRHPILEAGFQRYSASGDAAAVHCGDFYAGKGVGWVRVALPGSMGQCLVFNTHLHANYSHKCKALDGGAWQQPDAAGSPSAAPAPSASTPERPRRRRGRTVPGPGPAAWRASARLAAGAWLDAPYSVPQDVFAPLRVSQVLELAQVVRQVSGRAAAAVILGGDLNTKPHFLEFLLLRHLLPELADSWTAVHGSGAEEDAGHTCRAAGCTYRSTRQVPERIDYVLVAGLHPVACTVTLQRSPAGCSYSDHCAVQAFLNLPDANAATSAADVQVPGSSEGLLHCVTPFLGLRHPAALYAPPDELQGGVGETVAGTQARRVLAGLLHLLGPALDLLEWGQAVNMRHAKERLRLAAALLALALALCWAAGTVTSGSSSGWVAFLAAVAAGLAIIAVCMGGIADVSQAQVLAQGRAQAELIAQAVQAAITTQATNST